MINKSNYFFFLNLSPWPFLCSISSFNLFFSLSLMFKFTEIMPILFSMLLMSILAMMWMMGYSMELGLEGKSSNLLESGLKTSMILFISSEVWFFFSFFWAYFHYLLSPMMEIGLSWPPLGVEVFNFINVPLINTLILLSSGITVTVAHYFLSSLNEYKFFFYLFLTITLGWFFTMLQFLEYKSSFFSVGDSSFGCSFFVLTGFHGLHVIIGSMFLLLSLVISMKINSNSVNLVSFELSSWYWHFVDVVWIFLYFFIYYMTN